MTQKDLIRAEIERISSRMMNKCGQDICEYLLSFIDSLQQEQPNTDDLEADIEMEWDSFNKHTAKYGEGTEEVVWLNWISFVDIANYFYELGLNVK